MRVHIGARLFNRIEQIDIALGADHHAPRYMRRAMMTEISSLNEDQSDWFRRAGMQMAGTNLKNIVRAASSDLLLIRQHIMNLNGGAYAAGI